MPNDSGHGGYRRPSKPAPVSGPGRLSKRTDGRQPKRIASGGDYGDRQEMDQIQSGATMSESPTGASAGGGGGGMPIDPSGLVPLDAPSGRPEEPITAGLDEFTQTPPSQLDDATRERLQGYLPTLLWLASRPQASEQTRQFVRQLRADL